MEARIITVFNQKGGVGKTTVSVHLAGMLARANNAVLLVDADKQGTAINWIANAEEGKELPLRTANLAAAGGKLHKQIIPHIDTNDYIVIDCPPQMDSAATQSALLIADLALMPLLPSPADMWATEDAGKLVSHARIVNEGLMVRVLWNQFDRRRVIGRQAREVLADLDMTPLHAALAHRESFRKAAAMGQLVNDVPDAMAAREVDHLINELQELLEVQ